MQSSVPNPGPTPVLPKLRNGLTYTFNDYDYDGRPQWVIHDSGRNKFFIIGWPEYEMLMRWNLSNPEALLDAVNTETTLHVDMSDLENLLQFLAYNYLLQQNRKKIHEAAKGQQLFSDDNVANWLIGHYLFFRVPLWHPDKFLDKTKSVGVFMFSRSLFYIMMLLAVVAIYQISARWEQFISTFPSVFSMNGLFYYAIAYSIVKVLHEAGHAYKAKSYNIPVPSCGLAFLVFWPVLYTDTTLSWTLNSKKRLQIALAGIQIETYVTIIAALIWCNTNNLTLQTICYVTITVNWLRSLLVNVSPFMRFDGYYILSDLMKMPNLQYRAFTLTRWQLRRWLFGLDDPPPERYSRKIHNFLIYYSLATWVYRLSLYLGIAVLVYYMFFKILGIVLFVIELYYFTLQPVVREVMVWIHYKEKFKLNINTIVTLTVTVILIGVFFIPFSNSVEIPATVHYQHQFLYSPEDGVLVQDLPPVGTELKSGEIIAKIDSHELDYNLLRTRLEYEKLMSEMRRASVDENYANEKNSVISSLNKKVSEYQKLAGINNKLELKAPFNGKLVDIDNDLHVGSYVAKDQWLGDIINPDMVQVEAYVEQINRDLLKPGQSGYFLPEDISSKKIPVTLSVIELLNPAKLSCTYTQKSAIKSDRIIVDTPCYNASEYGGDIATYITEKGEYVPVNSVYGVLFNASEKVPLETIKRGHVIVKTKARSYAYRLFYQVKRILVQESDF